MPTRRKNINDGNTGETGDFKIQLASDSSGQYVEVMALDAGVIDIGKVDQGTGGASAWKVTADALPLPANAAQETGGNLATVVTDIGSVTETAPVTDIASSGLNGRLQRVAQRLSSMIALLPTALGTGGGLKVDGSGTALPVSGTVLVGQTGADGSTTISSGGSAQSLFSGGLCP